MLSNGLTVTVNVMNTAAMIRFFDRLERIASHAPPEIKAQIEGAVEDMLREMDAPPPSPHRFETKELP